MISLDSPPQAGPGPTTAAARAMAKTVPASTSTLKRKREEESKVHPSDAKPLLAIRKVVSRKVPTVLDTEGVPSPVKSTLPVGTQPSRTNGKIHMRKVISKKIKEDVPTSQDDQLQGSSVSAVPPQTQVPFSQNVIIITDPTTDSVHDEPKPEELLPPPLPSEESSKRSTTPNTELTPAPSIPSSELETEVRPQSGIRRTTRARKASQPQTDVFGPTTHAPVPRSRRRAPAPSTDSGFAGLTALALRTLTSSNTARNQQQSVALTTEIIRIEGTRPDSPTTKVRTILEKQKELKVQQRQERAERRRKTAEGLLSEDTNDVDVISEVEDTSVLLMERDVDGIPLRHRMGPGEEEEYITPPRIERPFKRGRLEDGPEVIDEKRVKWDRGLSTTVYFDPSSPKPAKSSTEEINKKGCLTPATKVSPSRLLTHLICQTHKLDERSILYRRYG